MLFFACFGTAARKGVRRGRAGSGGDYVSENITKPREPALMFPLTSCRPPTAETTDTAPLDLPACFPRGKLRRAAWGADEEMSCKSFHNPFSAQKIPCGRGRRARHRAIQK